MSNNQILLGYKKMLESFLIAMHNENPGLQMTFHTSFADFPEEYSEGKYVARADKQSGSPEFILHVSDDFNLPLAPYEEQSLLCTSWRNNNYNGGLPEDLSDAQRAELPADFDVVTFQGSPLSGDKMSTQKLSMYVIGGCALKIERDNVR